jgi:hypothetical protein
MSMSATISIPSTGTVNQPLVATLTVSNSGSSAVNLTSVAPLAYNTSGSLMTPGSSPVALGDVPLGPNSLLTVSAGGSLILTFPVIFSAPSNGTYSVGAYLQSNDGSSFSPTPATTTVTNFTYI